jgi:L-lactate dehydrogenase complex protein LldE
MRVALFITCYNDLLFPEVGQATVSLLERLGNEVTFPNEQTCCGQIHFNTGYREQCVPLVKQFTRAFAGSEVVVTPSASCAAMVRLHHNTVAEFASQSGDADLQSRVAEVAPRVYELTEFLVDVLGVVDVGARYDGEVTYHPTCHGRRMLHVGDRPDRLLQAVQGLTLLPLPNDDECCGFGGTFSVKNPDTSIAMGLDKIADVEASGARTVVAADTSCLMHLGGLIARQHRDIRVLHLAQVLAATGQTS